MTDQPTQTALELAQKYRVAVLKRDAAALARLIDAYGEMWRRIQKDVEILTLKIEAIQAAGGTISKGQLTRLAQYKDLLDAIQREVNGYGQYLAVEMNREARVLMAQASKDVKTFLLSMGYNARVASLSVDVLETLLGFLDPKGKLMRYWTENLGGADVARQIAHEILTAVGKGQNPRVLAKMIQKWMGENLTSALRTARTVQLTSYREATRANYQANGIKKWQWFAQLDDINPPCAACVSLHGKEFDTETPAEGHWNCRCVMLPVTIFFDPADVPLGEEWFKKQPEKVQRAIMGKSKFEAWQNGAFKFNALAQHNDDEVFGQMWGETPLKDLVGESELNALRSK